MKRTPKAILKFREKGTVIKKIGNNYYLYKARSVWDRDKGRSRLVTEKYLGKVTEEEGLIKPRHERAFEEMNASGGRSITVKEFGATDFMLSISKDIIEQLKRSHPDEWLEIYTFAMIRLCHASPLKNVLHYYVTSHLSDVLAGANVTPKHLSELLWSVGAKRGKTVEFMKRFVLGSKFIALDLTHVFSLSEGVISASLGHNSNGEYVPQVNIALVFSIDRMQPSFFRMVAGSIRDVSVVATSLKEAGVSSEKAVMVGDKGFYSARNVSEMEDEGIGYILPLKRSSSFIDYGVISRGNDEKNFDGYFMFNNKRVIWYSERKDFDDEKSKRGGGRRRLILFLDEKLKAEEKKDFLLHVEAGKKKMKEYYEYQHKFGTIAVITNSTFQPNRIFELLKSRVDIEQLFDTIRNLLHADINYMRDDERLEGWMFINFVAMLLFYKIYGMLLDKELLKRFSPNDVIAHLLRVHKIEIRGKWVLAEIPKTSRTLLQSMGIKPHIT